MVLALEGRLGLEERLHQPGGATSVLTESSLVAMIFPTALPFPVSLALHSVLAVSWSVLGCIPEPAL